jgi:hypothetical protein
MAVCLPIELNLLSRRYVICIHSIDNSCIVELEAYQDKYVGQSILVRIPQSEAVRESFLGNTSCRPLRDRNTHE